MAEEPGETNSMPPVSDEQVLERFGYRQELKRSLGYFSAFALSFSVISVTTGLFANYGSGLQIGGPAFIWTWLIVGAGQLLVALVFAQLARQIPLSGYAYQWTRQLAGDRLAWWAGWIMIVQFIAGMSGVCYAMANYLVPYLGLADKNGNVVAITIAILIAISLINHFGIRLSSLVNDFSVGAEILGTVAIGLLLLAVALLRKTHPVSFLLSHPAQPSGLAYLPAFASSALMSAWTIGGFEAAANVAEETHMPQSRVPTAIVLSEVASVLLGFPVLIGFTLAIPSLAVASQHSTPLLYIMQHYFPPYVTDVAMLLVFISIFACALANVTTLTRMVWAMARDGQLPASPWLARVSVHKVPANAIWTMAVIAAAFTCWAKVEVVITGVCTLLMYVVYGIVVGAALWGARRKSQASNVEEPVDAIAAPMAQIAGSRHLQVSRTLCIAALIWIVFLLAIISIPRSAWINTIASLAALGVGACWYFWGRPRKPADVMGLGAGQGSDSFVHSTRDGI
jgi:amino acid transporter